MHSRIIFTWKLTSNCHKQHSSALTCWSIIVKLKAKKRKEKKSQWKSSNQNLFVFSQQRHFWLETCLKALDPPRVCVIAAVQALHVCPVWDPGNIWVSDCEQQTLIVAYRGEGGREDVDAEDPIRSRCCSLDFWDLALFITEKWEGGGTQYITAIHHHHLLCRKYFPNICQIISRYLSHRRRYGGC